MNADLVAAFLIGFAGSVHCLGMCGGIASAFSLNIPKQANQQAYIYAYNIGRISSYSLIGYLAGSFGMVVADTQNSGVAVLELVSIIFLILMGLYISDWWRVLSKLENIGAYVWRFIVPVSKKLLPFKSIYHALLYGMVWGWLPCGLVYSALTWSMASGNPVDGALMMLFFGLGTLPAMLAISLGASALIPILQSINVRRIVGLSLLIFATYLIFSLIERIN